MDKETYKRLKARGTVKLTKIGTPRAWTNTANFAGGRANNRKMHLKNKTDKLPVSKQGGGYTGTTTQLRNKKIVPQKKSLRPVEAGA